MHRVVRPETGQGLGHRLQDRPLRERSLESIEKWLSRLRAERAQGRHGLAGNRRVAVRQGLDEGCDGRRSEGLILARRLRLPMLLTDRSVPQVLVAATKRHDVRRGLFGLVAHKTSGNMPL